MVCKRQGKNGDMQKWNEAIEDAEDSISKCERKIASLRVAVKIFQESRDDGAPYPGPEQR